MTSEYSEHYELLNKRVIARSNENEPARTGVLVRFDVWHSKNLPVVVMDDDNREYVVFGVLMPYRPQMLEMLNSMPYKEAWDFCVEFSRLRMACFSEAKPQDGDYLIQNTGVETFMHKLRRVLTLR